ncbi:DNA topoisomerase 2-like [Rhizophagus clarus]|uniref:DNA topoisomerase (ATP-hydrolyzing) n=1 Tax=Rhizophagus clarus TaxID=94130 RepID=A0A8H3MFQ9_9GLOM|nr:DNA topoisomerase 2-like [Rhizophagus clarus]
MDTIKVDIDAKSGKIPIYNNGNGITVEIHKEEIAYVPELIFGHLLTSYDYYDNERKLLEVETVTVLNRRISLLMYLDQTNRSSHEKGQGRKKIIKKLKSKILHRSVQNVIQAKVLYSLLRATSAKALAVDGFSDYGLRGKLLIVREGVQDQINISRLNKGNIHFNKKITFWPFYETNQDHDGGHTKGLIINFLNSSFRHCLKFQVEFITHIVQEITLRSRFYMREPTSWFEDNDEAGKLGITKVLVQVLLKN